MLAPQPANEKERLKHLLSLGILDTEEDEDFTGIVEIVTLVTGCPVSLISLSDSDRQWFKAKVGTNMTEAPRDNSFCSYTIVGEGPMVVQNALEDPRFQNNPIVAGGPKIRFYAGQPLKSSHGFVLGTLCAIDLSPRRLRDDQLRAIALLSQQVTALIDKKLALRVLQEERDLRERFVATLSHDLRTPIMAARLSAQLIERNPEIAPRAKAARIVENMNRADSMIQDILDASRIRAGEALQLKKSACELGPIAKEVAEVLGGIYGKRIQLASDEVSVLGNEEALRRVLENLVSNAAKYGAVDRPVRIAISAHDGFGILSVHNEGNPISPEEQPLLFKPFRRAGAGRVTGQRGWGLGLSLVKGLTEAMAGSVEVQSAPGEGTTFTVRVPMENLAATWH